MPLIQIHLAKGKSPKYIKAVADGIHKALVTAWKIPLTDRFQMINEYKKSHFHFDKTIWGVKRSDNLIAIYITSIARSVEMKKNCIRSSSKFSEKIRECGKKMCLSQLLP